MENGILISVREKRGKTGDWREGGREKRVEEAGIKYNRGREAESEGYEGRMECMDPPASLLTTCGRECTSTTLLRMHEHSTLEHITAKARHGWTYITSKDQHCQHDATEIHHVLGLESQVQSTAARSKRGEGRGRSCDIQVIQHMPPQSSHTTTQYVRTIVGQTLTLLP